MTTIVEWLKCKAHRAINISLLQFTVLMMMENLVEKLLLLRVSQQCPAECDSSIFLLFNFPNYFFISNIEVKKLWKRVWQRQVAHTEKKNLGRTLHIFCAKIFFFVLLPKIDHTLVIYDSGASDGALILGSFPFQKTER